MIEKFFYFAIKFCVWGMAFSVFVLLSYLIGKSSIYDGGKNALFMLSAFACFVPTAFFLWRD